MLANALFIYVTFPYIYNSKMEIIEPLKRHYSTDIRNHWLPLYSGEIACGLFGISEDFVENYLSLDEKFMKNQESTFFVRASGDSMMPEIKPEDILVVDRSYNPSNGSIVAIFYNGNPMCKQFVVEKGNKLLRSFNHLVKDIPITEDDQIEVFGVVIGLVRDFY
jgi:DNA polymerase V